MAFGNGGTIDSDKQAKLREQRKSALFSSQENNNNSMVFPKNVIVDVPIELIDENPDNEKIFSMNEIDRLAEQIKLNGYDRANPVTLFEKPDGRYELNSGHRRHRANLAVGNKTIPAVIKADVSTAEKAKSMLDSNIFNRVLTYYDYAQAVNYYRNNYLIPSGFKGNIRKELCAHFNISDTTLQRYMDFFKLIPELQEFAKDETFPGSSLPSASELSSDLQIELVSMIKQSILESVGDKKITSRQIATMIDTLKKKEQYKKKRENMKKQILEQDKEWNVPQKLKDVPIEEDIYVMDPVSEISEIPVTQVELSKSATNDYGIPSPSIKKHDINVDKEIIEYGEQNNVLKGNILYEANVDRKIYTQKADILVAMTAIENNINSIKYEEFDVWDKEKTIKSIENAIAGLNKLLGEIKK